MEPKKKKSRDTHRGTLPLPRLVETPQSLLQGVDVQPVLVLRGGPHPSSEPGIFEYGASKKVTRRSHPHGARDEGVGEAGEDVGDALARAASDADAFWLGNSAVEAR